MMETVFQDLRHEFRAFRRSPGFTTTAIVALALGIGASTAIFSVLNAVLLRPLPFPEPERVVIFRTTGDYAGSPASPAKFNFWREQMQSFQHVSAFRFGVSILGDGPNSERVPSTQVSTDFFRLFGVLLMQGRTFSAQEDIPGGGRVVVLSHRMWMRWFGGDRSAIGKTLLLNGERYHVIGILTPSADGEAFPDGWQSEGTADVWLPIQIDPASKDDSEYFTAAGRLRPGLTLAMAKAQMPVLAQQFRRRFPGDLTMGPKNGFAVTPTRQMLSGDIGQELWILAGAVGFVLLIACANVASRAAMGASRGRIIRQLLTENVMLSTIGGVLGLVVGMIGIRWLLTISPGNIPHIGENGSAVTADWRVLGFSLLVALGTGVVFGIFPALEVSRADLNEALKASGRRSGSGYRQSKIRSFLVTSEVTLALVLLTGAGLLIRTLVTVRSVNPGFDTNNVLAIQMSLNAPRFQKAAAVSVLVRDSLERIRALPGVIAAAHTCCLPLTGSDIDGAVVIVGRPVSNLSHEWARAVTVSPDYFDVLKIPLLRGRMFTDRDKSGAEPVVMINDAMARRFWRGTDDPLRASLEFEDLPGLPPRRIVGVVASAREIALTAEPQATVYFPVAQTPDAANTYILRTPVAWVIRTELSSHALSSAIQRELMQASGGVPLGKVRLMNEVLRDSTADRSFEMLLLSIFAGTALFLAAIGIYGLMAYAVEQRTQEIGVRMALGAESNDVRNMVVWQGMRLALAGVGMGMAAALVLRRVMENLVWGVETTDPLVFLTVPVVLSGVALLAVWLPARRASRTDPVEALRQE